MENIKTNRLILRKPRKSDSKALLTLLNNKDIQTYLPNWYCKDSNDINAFFSEIVEYTDYEEVFLFVIEDISTKYIVGIIDSTIFIDGSASICYAVKESARGRGIMPEALQAFITFLYNNATANVHSITFLIRKDNNSSLKVMKKLEIPYQCDFSMYHEFKLSLEEGLPF